MLSCGATWKIWFWNGSYMASYRVLSHPPRRKPPGGGVNRAGWPDVSLRFISRLCSCHTGGGAWGAWRLTAGYMSHICFLNYTWEMKVNNQIKKQLWKIIICRIVMNILKEYFLNFKHTSFVGLLEINKSKICKCCHSDMSHRKTNYKKSFKKNEIIQKINGTRAV